MRKQHCDDGYDADENEDGDDDEECREEKEKARVKLACSTCDVIREEHDDGKIETQNKQAHHEPVVIATPPASSSSLLFLLVVSWFIHETFMMKEGETESWQTWWMNEQIDKQRDALSHNLDKQPLMGEYKYEFFFFVQT